MQNDTDDKPQGDAKPKPETARISIAQRLKAHDEAVKDTPFAKDPDAAPPPDK